MTVALRGSKESSQHDSACGLGAVISSVHQAAEHRTQTHGGKVRSVHHACSDRARSSEAHHRELQAGKLAEGIERFYAGAQIGDLRHREGRVFAGHAFRALPALDEVVFVASQ